MSALSNATPDDDDDSCDEVIQHTVPAATAPSVKTSAPRSVFDWLPAGPDLHETPPTAPQPKSTTMSKPKSTPTARASGAESPQVMICNALASRPGSWARAELREACAQLTDEQFSNAIYCCAKAKRIRRNGHTFEITSAGGEFAGIAAIGHALRPKKGNTAARPSVQKQGQGAAQDRAEGHRPAVAHSAPPIGTTDPQPARYAAYSDGCFMVEKIGAQVLLTAEEARAMHAYLERMLDLFKTL